jgi:ComF family protein
MLQLFGPPALPESACVLCGQPHNSGSALCPGCLQDLPVSQSGCLRCGRWLSQNGVCGGCLNTKSAVDRTVVAYHYRYPVSLLIKNIKYKQELSLLPVLSLGLAKKLMASRTKFPEVLLPVPLFIARHYQRGFNQSLEICKILSRELGIHCDSKIAKRVRSTPPMSLLSPAQRRLNVKGAFGINYPQTYKSVAIVDDVVTSGATAEEIASQLKLHGAEQVEVWSLARA